MSQFPVNATESVDLALTNDGDTDTDLILQVNRQSSVVPKNPSMYDAFIILIVEMLSLSK